VGRRPWIPGGNAIPGGEKKKKEEEKEKGKRRMDNGTNGLAGKEEREGRKRKEGCADGEEKALRKGM